MRYPLVDGQGNFGSIDGDPPAAMRYTETKLASLSMEMLRDIDKDTVDFRPNFDDSLQEPSVLPTSLPTLLVNGAGGIAVGMATNIPPHNLREIIDGLQVMIKNPDVTIPELMEHVKAPDFPTGGIIYGYEGVKDAFLTGRGRVVVRAKASVEATKTKETIIITELPYQVSKASLIEKIADLTPMVVLNNLYKHTQLQTTFGVIMLALVEGRPRVLNLKQMMEEFLKHRNEVIVRRTRFELDAAEKRAHILEGFIIALDNIDAVIKTIKESKDTPTASINLQQRFGLSEIQAKAILEMRLQRLTGLERDKIQQEYREIIQLIERLRAILASKELQMQIISDELAGLRAKYGDDRRTEIVHDARDFTLEDMIANEEMIVTISHKGFIKRTAVTNYRRQHKGGRGASGAGTYEDDYVEQVFRAATHHYLLFFTVPENMYIFMATENGTVKKTLLSEFESVRANGKIAITLNDTDRLIAARITDGSNDIIIGSNAGLACRFRESDVRAMGRTAAGVIGMQLADTDRIISMVAIKRPDSQVIVVGQNGYGKRTNYEDFRLTKRGAKGVISMNITDKTGEVVSIMEVQDSDDLVVMTTGGILIRQPVKDVRIIGRNTQGVRLIRLEEGDQIADITTVPHEEDVDESGDDAPQADSQQLDLL